MSISYFPTKGF